MTILKSRPFSQHPSTTWAPLGLGEPSWQVHGCLAAKGLSSLGLSGLQQPGGTDTLLLEGCEGKLRGSLSTAALT